MQCCRFTFKVGMWALWCLGALAAAAQDDVLQSFTLTDYLDRTWSHELVSFPLNADAAAVAPEMMRLVKRTDNDADADDIRFQVGRDDNGKRCIWFFVDLAPAESKTFDLKMRQRTAEFTPPIRNLHSDRTDDTIAAWTDKTGIRLATAEGAFRNGPVVSIRLENGDWVGGSRLDTEREIQNYSASILQQGPLFVDLQCNYNFADGRSWMLHFRVMAGEPVVLVRETFDLDAESAHFALELSKGLQPDFMLYRESGINGRRQRRESIRYTDDNSRVLFTLEPWVHWWRGRERGLWLALGRSGHPSLLYVASRRGADWVDPDGGANAGSGLLRANRGNLEMQFDLTRRQRHWMIGSIPAAGAYPDPDDNEALLRTTPPQQLHIKYTTARLDKIKDWHLDWEMDTATFPRLYVTPDQLEAVRRKALESSYWAPRIENAASKAGFNLRQIHWSLVKQDDPEPGWNYASSHGKKQEYITYYLLTGDPDYGRGIAHGAEGAVRGAVNRYLLQRDLFTTPGNDPPRTSRAATNAVNMIDLAFSTDHIPEHRRRRLFAKLAFVAYQLADPDNYSHSRGFAANPNMTSMMHSTLAIYACALRNHPMAETWAQAAVTEYEHELANWIGPNGAWLENPHYQFASVPGLLAGSLALRNAGIHDFLKDGQLRKTMIYSAKLATPPDPRYGNARILPSIGDGPGGARQVEFGCFANVYRDIDPAFAAVMQWTWKEMGFPRRGGLATLDLYKDILVDRSLTATTPDWTSEWFPKFGVVLRHGFPGRHETYLAMHQGSFHAHYGNDRGSIHMYGKGAPLVADFGPQYQPRVAQAFMHNKVSIAHSDGTASGTVAEFANQKRADYVCMTARLNGRGTPGMPPGLTLEGWPAPVSSGKADWKRQLLLIKDDVPTGATYLVFRDTVQTAPDTGTQWTMWSLSEKIGTPQQTADLDAFLADAPGAGIVPNARRLPQSSRYTAIGQFGVDLEYYIAAPANTPRHTLRWGFKLKPGYSGIPEGIEEWQDVLHLQLRGSGQYAGIMYPRLRSQPMPSFETMGDGSILRVSGTFGTDYVFLADSATDASAERVTFKGTAASLQDHGDTMSATLSSAGEVSYRQLRLKSDVPCSLHLREGIEANVQIPPHDAGKKTVTAWLPGAWGTGTDAAGVKIAHDGEVSVVQIPADRRDTTLIRK